MYKRMGLLRNEGDGIFSDASNAMSATPGTFLSVAWGDYDSDGDLDFFALGRNSGNRLMRNNGDGTFMTWTPGVLNFHDLLARSPRWVDYDGDGDLDLYIVWATISHDNVLYRHEGDGAFVYATVPPLDSPGTCEMSSWADYDHDGDPDVLIAKRYDTVLLRNDGDGVFEDVTAGDLLGVEWVLCGVWGDYDNDEDLDLYLTGTVRGGRVLRNDGDAVFTDVTEGDLITEGMGHEAAWVDFDNDGWLDLNVIDMNSGVKLFRGLGDGTFLLVETGYPLGTSNEWNPYGAAWCDYDDDGDLDLHLTEEWDPDHSNRMIMNKLDTGNHWLEVDLVGTESHAYGVGARIRVVAGERTQIREVGDGDCGSFGRSSLTAEFGLGTARYADTLQISWPSGTFQEFLFMGADQRLLIHEDEDLTSLEDSMRPAAVLLHRCSPNPFCGATRIGFELPRSAQVTIRVHDISGRLVRTLLPGVSKPAGSHHLIWDGTSDAGERVVSGIYVYSLETDGVRETRRALVLR
jgi:hypothetical protein